MSYFEKLSLLLRYRSCNCNEFYKQKREEVKEKVADSMSGNYLQPSTTYDWMTERILDRGNLELSDIAKKCKIRNHLSLTMRDCC